MAQVSTPTYSLVATDEGGNVQAVNGERILATKDLANLNVTTKTSIFTVPTGYTAHITRIVVRNASTSLTTASFGFGFNASANDVDGSTTHTELTGSTLMSQIIVLSGSKVGVAADVFGVKCSIAQGAAATVSIDVFGYLVAA